ncbi:Chaperone protein DnaJ 20 [Citrus sinensis]|uniref:Chaperone protein DnaJ 20 n=3 Tax=Citrus TaxID=2706 RepID=A0ACB8I0J7_CITSI|nr:chaperone protein dnaJ 20, chloroplastic [Citrus sinensis]KAH9649626.1 Chaperone protein DnaJ 20 [Citrus sinensis]KAH9680520.1 Chaperone protein DnaJ 20 [Citrus sinensis]KDO50654.1 hypothetical protein CISIN_1g028571mg [Citrus sinensis]GAY61824.1 hypothetical protein CUMW_213010 [Citrus unshiu]
MRCSSYGLIIPGSESRFLTTTTTPTTNKKPDRFPRIYPTSVSFGSLKVKAKLNDAAGGTATATAVVDESKELSFYDLLGIPESVSLVEIKQAYKQMARKYHPDVSPPDRVEEYTQRFIRVQEAYETLSDPGLRALYDRDLSMGLHLAFSARRRQQNDVDFQVRSEWRNRWQSQLSELKRRSMNKDAGGNISWAARMRRKRDGLSQEL